MNLNVFKDINFCCQFFKDFVIIKEEEINKGLEQLLNENFSDNEIEESQEIIHLKKSSNKRIKEETSSNKENLEKQNLKNKNEDRMLTIKTMTKMAARPIIVFFLNCLLPITLSSLFCALNMFQFLFITAIDYKVTICV